VSAAGAAARRPYGVVGVFLLLLGVGVILDADRTVWGSGLVLAGAACLIAERRHAGEE
jgi:membrane-bound ClpP family serine protease